MHPTINLEWWNGLSRIWKNIFKKNTKSNPENSDFFDKIQALTSLTCGGSFDTNERDKIKIYDLEPLRALPNLIKLDCNYTQISSLEPLHRLPKLTELDCSFTEVSSLELLRNAEKLTFLACWNTQVGSLEPLRNLQNLKRLECGGTTISSLEPLHNLLNLSHLECDITIHNGQIQALQQKNPNCEIVLSNPFMP